MIDHLDEDSEIFQTTKVYPQCVTQLLLDFQPGITYKSIACKKKDVDLKLV